MSKSSKTVRFAEVDRETAETEVRLTLDLDGGSKVDVDTGIPFFDHMLQQLGFHGQVDLGVKAMGDTDVDDHHTIEDTGIVIGVGIKRALDPSEGIARFGSVHAPMDDALVLVAMDVCGRGYLSYDVPFTRESIGGFSLENVREFFQALALNAGITLHIKKISGHNDHHVCEAVFKGFGVALHAALQRTERIGTPSTKGKIGT
ncbi:MAG TPA: imidazoleglycerol-phosphate dehydratase HisB [Fimbriimonadaceae bacterium]|nr:imidazoleglycerol-phosphate dehydratase HisB [Fimbriimonadaceae bacterium]